MTDSPVTAAPSAASPATALALTDAPASALDAHGHDPSDYDWIPVLRKPRADGWSPQRQRRFIGELADCGSVMTAARRVGMSASGAYALRRSVEGRAFAAAWDSAIQQAAHALIDAAFERAINGSDEPVFDRDGHRVGRRFRQSDALMMFLLRKHFPERYGDLYRDRAPGAVAAPAPPVAETMIALEPVRPADPAALMPPGELAVALEVASVGTGRLPHWLRDPKPGGSAAEFSLGAEFEAELEMAKRAADPLGHARAEERIAAIAEEEAETRERSRRRRR
jgi:hypothetical protein